MTIERPWNAPVLRKGENMNKVDGDLILSITNMDRRIDPYFAAVTHKNIVVYTGLHATLSSARTKCEMEAKVPR